MTAAEETIMEKLRAANWNSGAELRTAGVCSAASVDLMVTQHGVLQEQVLPPWYDMRSSTIIVIINSRSGALCASTPLSKAEDCSYGLQLLLN